MGEFRISVAVTDWDWFSFLRRQPDIDEVNFWQPSPTGTTSEPGTPWLFKLHAPRNAVVGGGFFAYYTHMPLGVAWEAFGEKNGVASLFEMRSRVAKYRRARLAARTGSLAPLAEATAALVPASSGKTSMWPH
ncbi:hypothetical protein EPN42_02655 [bacterium]|nr:MAG: hypothetical protein EPN42_02655 [bacterium]